MFWERLGRIEGECESRLGVFELLRRRSTAPCASSGACGEFPGAAVRDNSVLTSKVKLTTSKIKQVTSEIKQMTSKASKQGNKSGPRGGVRGGVKLLLGRQVASPTRPEAQASADCKWQYKVLF